MRKSLLVALFFILLPASLLAQEMVARYADGDVIRLTGEPCHAAVVPKLTVQPERWRAAQAQVGKRQYLACWALRADGIVLLTYEDGDGGLVPLSQFKAQPGI